MDSCSRWTAFIVLTVFLALTAFTVSGQTFKRMKKFVYYDCNGKVKSPKKSKAAHLSSTPPAELKRRQAKSKRNAKKLLGEEISIFNQNHVRSQRLVFQVLRRSS